MPLNGDELFINEPIWTSVYTYNGMGSPVLVFPVSCLHCHQSMFDFSFHCPCGHFVMCPCVHTTHVMSSARKTTAKDHV